MPLSPRNSGDALTFARELVQQGIAASKSGDKRRARELLTQAVQVDPQNEQAWLWLSDTLTDAVFRRICLEKVLAINPASVVARRGLGALAERPAVSEPPAIRWPPSARAPQEPDPPPASPLDDDPLRDHTSPSPASIPNLLRPSNASPASPPIGSTCLWCGAHVSSKIVLMCPACDHPLEFECPDCRESVPLEVRECPHCGRVMGDFTRQRPAYLSDLGEAYRARGLPDKALPVYLYLSEMQPQSAPFHLYLSELYDQLEQSEQSAAEAERAVELDPLNPAALYRLGHWYVESGQHDKAGDLAARLTRLQNRSPRLTLLLGDLEYERREYPAALRAYLQVGKVKVFDEEFDAPTRATVHYRLGEMYRLAEDLQSALKSYQACRDTQADLYEVRDAQHWVDTIRPPLPPQASRSHMETLRAMIGPLLLVWLTGAVAIGFRFDHLTFLGGLGLVGALVGCYAYASAVYTPLTIEWREALGEAGLTRPLPRRIALLASGGLLLLSLGLVLFGM
jgi:tetratricopeptide (TPR) repeat protein